MPTETLRVESSSRAARRFSAGFVTFLVLYAGAVFVIGGASWTARLVAVGLLVGQVPLAVMRFVYAEITDEGLDLDLRVRRRHIPWDRVERFELGDASGRQPRLLLTDDTQVKSIAFGGFVGSPHVDAAVVERLRGLADTHNFTLVAP